MVDQSKSRRTSQAKPKRAQETKPKGNRQMLALAIIFVMLIVSYVVIFASPNEPVKSENMTFSQDQEDLTVYHGHVDGISHDLSEVYVTIYDAGTDTRDTITDLAHMAKAETPGGFNCTFYDENGDGMLSSDDEFVVHNTASGDWIKVYLKETNTVVASYTF